MNCYINNSILIDDILTNGAKVDLLERNDKNYANFSKIWKHDINQNDNIHQPRHHIHIAHINDMGLKVN